AAAALLALLVLGALFVVRGRQLARAEARTKAQTTWAEFQEEARTAQFLLYTRTAEPEQLRVGAERAETALAHYRILQDDAWPQGEAVRHLPPAAQAQLRDAAGELLLLLARARLLQATDLPDGPARTERLEEAVRLNDRAEACSERAARSQGLWRQRAELARLTGDAAAARHNQRAA